jgi:hypothetical protein
MANRLGNFIIFVLLTLVTVGIYPLYFHVTRMQEQTDLLRELIRVTEAKKCVK